jgi:4-aminobutyrate aminotransferase-like enzyme/Ser/Thr protein kinase RdoA (MazF antagonist)
MTVLEAPPPRFSATEIAAIARDVFGVDGVARDLGSERDQTFLIDDGASGGILKVSNPAEDPATLDLEAAAILHVARVDPALPVARPRPAPGDADPADPAAYRASVEGPDGRHFVRLFERMPGRSVDGPDLDDDALHLYGATQARLARALRGLFHPAAGRELLWDLAHTPKLRPLLGAVIDPARRALVEPVLDRFDTHVAPAWPALRAQLLHADFTLDNVLVDDAGRVSGIVDFGDMGHTAVAADAAIGLLSLMRGRPAEDAFRAARIALDGFRGALPLEDAELAVLGDLVAARAAALVVISAWRVERHPENAAYIQAWDAGSWELLELFASLGPEAFAAELGAPRPPQPTAALAERRRRILGPALTGLTYRRPVHVVRAEGVWLHDADGSRLLDAYNNVPVVGHCHPRVTEAVVRQTRRVNTHARYLYEPLVELAERLVASMPAGSGLDTVALVNSGSEANDLAWRIARAATGGDGAIVTSFAYHGVSDVIADLSPEEWPPGHRPERVETIPPDGDLAADLAGAAAALAGRGRRLAAAYVDGGFTSDGVVVPEPSAMAALVQATHAAGGLYVADEVQIGHGRTGRHLWSFAASGITPDLVTLGKPMGNGYPVAALITRGELMERLAETTTFFSTFGGNPVAAAAAVAVLDVIEDERVVGRTAAVGAHLRAALDALASRHPVIAGVRSVGLLAGVQLAEPDLAVRAVDALRDAGVLVGRTGPRADVLKVRPPLAFREAHVDLLAERLDAVLATLG